MFLLVFVVIILVEIRYLFFIKKGEKFNFSFYYYNIIGNVEEM